MSKLLDLIQHYWPGQCLLCYGPSQEGRDLCLGCQRELPWVQQACSRCGLALQSETCQACLKNPPSWDAIYPVWHYGFPLNRLLNAWKHQGRAEAGRCLSQLWLEWQQLPPALPDCLIPVPLHWTRRWWRGFDQAQILSQQWSGALGLRQNNLIKRHRRTPAQQTLSARQRRINLEGAFSLQRKQSVPKHIALVDDVVTTGSTVSVLCRLLREAGCQRIDIWCLARTPAKPD